MTYRFVPTLRTVESFKAFFDELNWNKADWPPLDNQEIRTWCQVYLECPLIPPDPRFIKLLMYSYMKAVLPKISSSAEEDAARVEGLIKLGGSIGEARNNVADVTGKSPETITKAHMKYGSTKAARGSVRKRSKEDLDREKLTKDLVSNWRAKRRDDNRQN